MSLLLRYRTDKLPGGGGGGGAQNEIARNLTEKVRGLSWKFSLANFTLTAWTANATLATSWSDTCPFSVCVALIVRGVVPCHQRKQPWKYSKGNSCYWHATNVLALIPSFFSPCGGSEPTLNCRSKRKGPAPWCGDQKTGSMSRVRLPIPKSHR